PPGGLVHQLDERFFAPGDRLGQLDGSVVRRTDGGGDVELPDRVLVAPGQKDPAADLARRVFADRDDLIPGEFAGTDRLQHQIFGHHLGHAGGRQRRVGVLFEQHLAGLRVDQDGGRRVDLRRSHRLLGGGGTSAGGQGRNGQKYGQNGGDEPLRQRQQRPFTPPIGNLRL